MLNFRTFAALLLFLASFAACQRIFLDGSSRLPLANGETEVLTEFLPPKFANCSKVRIGRRKSPKLTPGICRNPYPNGDIATETGVCTDVVIRAFRAAGVDLQKEVHEDMKENFALYPTKWNLPATRHKHRPSPRSEFADIFHAARKISARHGESEKLQARRYCRLGH